MKLVKILVFIDIEKIIKWNIRTFFLTECVYLNFLIMNVGKSITWVSEYQLVI